MDADFEVTLRNDQDEEIHLTGTVEGEYSPADRSVGIMCEDWHAGDICLYDEDGKDIPLKFLSAAEREKVEQAAQDAIDRNR